MALAMMRATVAASVAASANLAQQARAAASSPAPAAGGSLATASAAARATVADFERDFYEKKIFDPYLKFASKEDEQAYRKREGERQAEINAALARNTPEGNLRAAELSEAQLKDAGAHGADASPEYAPWNDKLESTRTTLRAAMEPAEQAKAKSDRLALLGDAPPEQGGVGLPADLIAKLQSAGVTGADPDTHGHGVTVAVAAATLASYRG